MTAGFEIANGSGNMSTSCGCGVAGSCGINCCIDPARVHETSGCTLADPRCSKVCLTNSPARLLGSIARAWPLGHPDKVSCPQRVCPWVPLVPWVPCLLYYPSPPDSDPSAPSSDTPPPCDARTSFPWAPSASSLPGTSPPHSTASWRRANISYCL